MKQEHVHMTRKPARCTHMEKKKKKRKWKKSKRDLIKDESREIGND
jgi:hypothetical protein